MFEFTDLDGMPRAEMLRKQKDTQDYWRAMHRLKGAFLAWGTQTTSIINMYKFEGQDNKLMSSLDDAAVRGEITVIKLTNLLVRLDEYLKQMDTRLSDGTRWNTAAEISKIFDETQGG